ncbi:MAG TPA: HAMP domain-containing sensor histidine kinase [Candidatus Limnocylindrales bacterium]|nr:HAMP domain-containing sensor histidine kinase [Candidatus Limnocylindrales bacterium]
MADHRATDPAAAGAPQAFDSGWAPTHGPRQRRPSVPQSFQTRLTFAFMGVVALTLALVAPIVINRLDDYFRQLEEQSLTSRANATARILTTFMIAAVPPNQLVVRERADGTVMLHPRARALLEGEVFDVTARAVAQADTTVTVGLAGPDTDGELVVQPESDLVFTTTLETEPEPGQAKDPAIAPQSVDFIANRASWGLIVTLSNPYTSRASTLANVTALLLILASVAFLVAVLVAAFLAHRFTTPLTRLTDASRRLADGDLTSRVASDELSQGTLELRELSQQFNAMADRLEESVNIIRRDRDYSRDFLADVSHELRTPIAAMKTHVELLQGPAGRDEAARAEFLHSSSQQLDRLDWLAQNLLELSKLDSGLVLLDLRPEDVRGTIESAVEQQRTAAERKDITLTVTVPDRPLRISHDPPRVGQIVSNLVGNAIKFTPPGGEIRVLARAEPDGGARLEVVDTGVGMAPEELPHIFDRFYRGAEENRARSTGSGLGLAIVRSIVDMHHGSIAVESRRGVGSRFVVELPRDPRSVTDVAPPEPDAGTAALANAPGKVDDSSPKVDPPVNPRAASLAVTDIGGDTEPAAPPERRPPTP